MSQDILYKVYVTSDKSRTYRTFLNMGEACEYMLKCVCSLFKHPNTPIEDRTFFTFREDREDGTWTCIFMEKISLGNGGSDQDWKRIIHEGCDGARRIKAIKIARDVHGISLKNAKKMVEDYLDSI